MENEFKKSIAYREGYKYQLADTYKIKINIIGKTINTEFIDLTPVGVLTIYSGYSWDGASGSTIDTKSSMRCSLVHDALYQLLRQGYFNGEEHEEIRLYADDLLKEIGIEDGMWELRANLWDLGVGLFARSAAACENKKKIFTAGIKKEIT